MILQLLKPETINKEQMHIFFHISFYGFIK